MGYVISLMLSSMHQLMPIKNKKGASRMRLFRLIIQANVYLASARPMNLRSSTLILIRSPLEICSGTCTVKPVDNFAGLVRAVAEPPFKVGQFQRFQAQHWMAFQALPVRHSQ